MGSPIIIHEINPCSFYWYFKILLSLGQPVSLSCEVIGWTENTPHCLCPLENSYSTWHITASCSCNRTGLRPCLRNIRKRYRHQSPHKTTLLLTSCLFSFPITWQMRLIWSVNVIQRLLVKQVVLSSWCIVQASVSNNILLSMFNSRHHSVYRALVLFPVLTWIQHKHGEQQRQQKITSLCSQLWSSSRQHSALVQARPPGVSNSNYLGPPARWCCPWEPVEQLQQIQMFLQPKMSSIYRYLHSYTEQLDGWCQPGVSTKIVPILFLNTLLDINI